MTKFAYLAGAALAFTASPALADASSGHKDQARGEQEIPVCTHKIGTLAIVPARQGVVARTQPRQPRGDHQDLRPAVGLLHHGQPRPGDESRAMERALADQGEMQRGSNYGKGQVKAADYFLQPDIVSTNKNSGGGGAGAAIGGFLGHFGGWRGRGRRAGRRDQRQEGRGQRHSEPGQRPHHRGRGDDRRLCAQDRRQLGRGRRRAAGGAASPRRARADIRTPRSAR